MTLYSIGDILVDHIYDTHYLVEDIVFNTQIGEYRYSMRYLEQNMVVQFRISEIDGEGSWFEKVA